MVHNFPLSAGHARHIGRLLPSLTMGALLTLSACASLPPPDNAMNLAQSQLQVARDAGAADYAPVDLDFAQSKFQQAQTAMASRDYDKAASFAEEARADAELARAKARLGAVRAQIQGKVDENAQLRAQMEQPANAPAPAAAPGSSTAPRLLDDMPAPSASVLNAPTPQDPDFTPAPELQDDSSPGHPPAGGQP